MRCACSSPTRCSSSVELTRSVKSRVTGVLKGPSRLVIEACALYAPPARTSKDERNSPLESRPRGALHPNSKDLHGFRGGRTRLHGLGNMKSVASVRIRGIRVSLSILGAKPLEPLDPSSRRPRSGGLFRGVTAERACLDARREMVAEGSVVVADPVQSGLDDFPHGEPGPLAGGGGLAVTSSEADRRRELLGDGVDLLAGALGLPGVVEAFGLVQLVAQLEEPLAVGDLGRRVQYRQSLVSRPLVRVTPHAFRLPIPFHAADQIANMK